MSELLKLTGVSVSYGPIRALVDADLTVEAGELVAVLGANGAGKSTLLRAISGLVRPGGRVWVDGDPVERLPPHVIARLGVAHVPERRGTFAELSVEENLRVAAHGLKRRRARLTEMLERVWSLFPALIALRGRQAGTLSGGEQQMLAIGRGLMMDPRLLLLDEPSLGLAPRVTAEIFAQIRELNRAGGIGVLLIEQNARMALGIADRGYVLQAGRVALAGDACTLQGNHVVQSAYLAG